ncbi:transporter associated domain-containing protein [Stieleria magnilauensis]
MEDLVEAVVGDIDVGDIDVGNGGAEPSSRQARRCQKLSEDSYLMDGRLTIHEANDVLGLNLPATEFHTVGGMLVARLHHLAKPGESVVEGGYRFTVEEASETSVRSVKVTRESFGEAD